MASEVHGVAKFIHNHDTGIEFPDLASNFFLAILAENSLVGVFVFKSFSSSSWLSGCCVKRLQLVAPGTISAGVPTASIDVLVP